MERIYDGLAPEGAKNDKSSSEPLSTSSKSINREHKNPDSGDRHSDATLPEESHKVSVDRLRNKVLPVVTPDHDNECENKVRELELKIVALTIAKKSVEIHSGFISQFQSTYILSN
ncbi:unnamed protein product [Allacma fusca]|uniref:Uncharacterized protein n=1 Tax=Allacma fusca TaxID=39272 RepID=A0A8J2M740_9HEXA|nr:unnamed protein product [Allacma fusca]